MFPIGVLNKFYVSYLIGNMPLYSVLTMITGVNLMSALLRDTSCSDAGYNIDLLLYHKAAHKIDGLNTSQYLGNSKYLLSSHLPKFNLVCHLRKIL